MTRPHEDDATTNPLYAVIVLPNGTIRVSADAVKAADAEAKLARERREKKEAS